MKKIIIITLLLIIYIFIIQSKLSTVFIEKIDLNLTDDELAIIFLSSDDYQAVLLKKNENASLIILNVNDTEHLVYDLNKFVDEKLNYLFINDTLEIKNEFNYLSKRNLSNNIDTDFFSIHKFDNIIKIDNNKYNFCIYDIGNNDDIKSCDFIYFLNMDVQIDLQENIKAIFYESNIESIFKEKSYIKWIDNYELSSDAYNILKISNDSYDILTIPNEN